MPKDQELVVFMDTSYRIKIGYFSPEDDEWYGDMDDIDNGFFQPRDAVTHWFPLPELPIGF